MAKKEDNLVKGDEAHREQMRYICSTIGRTAKAHYLS